MKIGIADTMFSCVDMFSIAKKAIEDIKNKTTKAQTIQQSKLKQQEQKS